jgi:hypothetical protein
MAGLFARIVDILFIVIVVYVFLLIPILIRGEVLVHVSFT